ncbi:MAG: hypothetical protein J0H04_12065 [Hyphomicrobium denitrificans]|uniref:hypothetical protein n=1 Tax=Hyphomicrobium denitrificans TaxID=53399 RepID=UPI0002E2224A|nr:hypothetical protein [Hyphomicrobium denitrificans]MBN9354659.1 hypothetical protein [Hyphomicrobium denitrificans]
MGETLDRWPPDVTGRGVARLRSLQGGGSAWVAAFAAMTVVEVRKPGEVGAKKEAAR